ncbi:MAG: hypothetical protein LBG45_02870 [Dysgonamonadaceae bacterium]|jgi:outer membrane murein-binding lipoprotein Lpp|nr:hypothetical protein [Dysgonamonadaceae bacterium]
MLSEILNNMFIFVPVFLRKTMRNFINRLIIKKMKKLVLFFAMVAVVAFSACTNKAKEEPAQEPVQTEEPAPVQEEVAPAEATEATEAPVETPAETPAE